jgi:hypothetical protein
MQPSLGWPPTTLWTCAPTSINLACGGMGGHLVIWVGLPEVGRPVMQLAPSSRSSTLFTPRWPIINADVAFDDHSTMRSRRSLTRYDGDGLAIAERLAAADPANAQTQRDLSVSYNKLGDVMSAVGNLAEAERLFRDGLATAERLAAADPANAQTQRDLSAVRQRIDDLTPTSNESPLTA